MKSLISFLLGIIFAVAIAYAIMNNTTTQSKPTPKLQAVEKISEPPEKKKPIKDVGLLSDEEFLEMIDKGIIMPGIVQSFVEEIDERKNPFKTLDERSYTIWKNSGFIEDHYPLCKEAYKLWKQTGFDRNNYRIHNRYYQVWDPSDSFNNTWGWRTWKRNDLGK